MASVDVGSLTLVSNITSTGEASFTTSLPSGRKVILTQDSLEKSKDPAYVEMKRSEVTSKLSDPADIAAINSYYDNIGSQATTIQEELGTEILDQQLAAEENDEADPNYPSLNNNEELNNEYEFNDGMDDDRGDENPPPSEAELLAWAESPDYQFMSDTVPPTPTTVAGKAGADIKPAPYGQGDGALGRRTYNPLSEFSSYNYQLSLYMLSPEAANLYTATGYVGRDRDGWYTVAQSGGINNTAGPGKIPRPPGMDLDFHIDDLEFTILTGTKGSQTPVTGVESFNFKVYEPYGISFNSKLVNAAKEIMSKSKMASSAKNTNALSQCYALGIRFYGYDKNGTLMTSKMMANSDGSTTDENALFERFYLMTIKSLSFKLDGHSVIYNIAAVNTDMKFGVGTMRGLLPASVNLVGSTVAEMLVGKGTTSGGSESSGTESGVLGLIDFLNQKEKDNCKPDPKNKNERKQLIPNTYAIKFDEPGLIDTATMVDPREFDQYKDIVAMTPVSKTSESTSKAEEMYKTVNKNVRSYQFASGSSIIAAIEQVISNSSYITGALTQVGSVLKETEPVKNPNPTEFNWFNVIPRVEYGPFDEKAGQYSLKITYHIKKYSVPFIRTGFVKYTPAYPGPHKVYDYWYSGKNTEILRYEQTFNNLYYITATGATQAKENLPVPTKVQPSAGSTTGQPNKAAEGVNSVKEDLYSPGDLLNAKIEILGDPDYLHQKTSTGVNTNDLYTKIYSPKQPNFTMDPTGGQVFIEISFKHVTDYYHGGKPGTAPGTMDISDEIRFYVYPGNLKDKIKAMTYTIKTIKSKFSKGKFTQTLDIYMADLHSMTSVKNTSDAPDENRAETERLQRQNDNLASNSRETEQANPDVEAVATDTEFGDLDGAIRTQEIMNEAAAMDAQYNFDYEAQGASSVIEDEFGYPVQDDDAWPSLNVATDDSESFAWAGDDGREEESDLNTLNFGRA